MSLHLTHLTKKIDVDALLDNKPGDPLLSWMRLARLDERWDQITLADWLEFAEKAAYWTERIGSNAGPETPTTPTSGS